MGGLLGGSKGGSTKVPKVDESALIRQNEAVNRVGVSTPFGSQSYVTDANGRRVLQTTLTPEMQQMLSQQMSRANTSATPYQMPQGQNQLLANIMGRLQGRYQPAPQEPQGGP